MMFANKGLMWDLFRSISFAGLLFLLSNVNKTALIFHENNEVFVNREIWCNSTCSTISLFLLVYWRECINKLPTVLEVSNKQEIPNKREGRSRKNTPEEKRNQNKEWRKRKRQQKNAGNLTPFTKLIQKFCRASTMDLMWLRRAWKIRSLFLQIWIQN